MIVAEWNGWMWITGMAIGFLTLVWGTAIATSECQDRRFRKICKQRAALQLEDWVRTFYPARMEERATIGSVLAIVAEQWGVSPGSLRPDDVLYPNYGFLSPLILDCPCSDLGERLVAKLGKPPPPPQAVAGGRMTLDFLIRHIVTAEGD